MRLFGYELVRRKAAPAALAPAQDRGWASLIREPFAGAWQRNEEISLDTAFSNPVLFRCISLIASDISKVRCRLVRQDDGIWAEGENAAFSPVLRKPNRYQNRIQFFGSWAQSKLATGNAVVLKERDNRGVVNRLHVLDWSRIKPLVAPDGEVYYQLQTDRLAGLPDTVTVPASEVIHDRWNTLFHPLVGLSPVYACGITTLQGLEIQQASTKFFRNGSRPGGVLTAAGQISDDTARRLKEHWETNYTGDNIGKVAVLGDGLKYEAMAVNADDAQLIEILKWSGETICGCFGVPPFMAGVGAAPLNNNVQALWEQYYAQCLQILIESIELCLDEGLGLDSKKDGVTWGTEFDLDDLLRMDTSAMVAAEAEAVKGGIKAPNEARRRLNLGPVKGGETPYLQQQNYSLAALAARDAAGPPKADGAAPTAATPVAANDDTEQQAAAALIEIRKGLGV